MKLLALIALLLLCGCDRKKPWLCDNGQRHVWTKWQDTTNVSLSKAVLQERHCTNCNVISREWHQ